MKLFSKELVEPKDRAISDDDVSEAAELVVDRVRDSNLVEPLFDEVPRRIPRVVALAADRSPQR